ncbi:hypothetical protein BU16DRAFT_368160 [Lophium mytilinum]|uniref:RING-type domain-containing protein n=1 Tax=Lophium mytilinum TaxID=390894 RepID=A0A6A6QUH0_9PEZI|nr:hypothetical protein BU16DRAFT_368160 [Lophium mytilinum]
MATRLPIRQTEVIVLSDDSDSDTDSDSDQHTPQGSDLFADVIDIDDDFAAVLVATDDVQFQDPRPASRPPTPFTEDDALQKILDIFPDIAHDHVLNLYREGLHDGVLSSVWCDQLITRLVDSGSYPKESERRRKDLKRKRTDTQDDEDAIRKFEKMERHNAGRLYSQLALKFLGNEFLNVPVKHIEATLRADGTLFKAFTTLAEQLREYDPEKHNPFTKVRARIMAKSNDVVGDPSMDYLRDDLKMELDAARKKRLKDEANERLQKELQEEIDKAVREETAVECDCCCGSFPVHRMTECEAATPHFFCCECARTLVHHLIGDGKCRPTCMSTKGCSAGFARQQLKIFLDQVTFDKLESMQQREDVLAAGIEGLAECPFCDFRADCPPVEIDREFRCRNPGCEKVSCRLCRAETHIPQSCEEYAKENKLSVRHAVEEAMTNALIRICNKCQHPFIKDFGCNKMVCTRCGNKQCYVCSKTVVDYNHFKENGPCPLHDNTDQRHTEDVKKAETEALAKVRAENPELTDEDLKVKVSDTVRLEEEARAQRAQGAMAPGRLGAYVGHFHPHQPQHPQHLHFAMRDHEGLAAVGGGAAAAYHAPALVPPPGHAFMPFNRPHQRVDAELRRLDGYNLGIPPPPIERMAPRAHRLPAAPPPPVPHQLPILPRPQVRDLNPETLDLHMRAIQQGRRLNLEADVLQMRRVDVAIQAARHDMDELRIPRGGLLGWLPRGQGRNQ